MGFQAFISPSTTHSNLFNMRDLYLLWLDAGSPLVLDSLRIRRLFLRYNLTGVATDTNRPSQ